MKQLDPVDNILKLESKLGLFSNVAIAASYRHESNKPLTSNIIFRALRLVIDRHPSLRVLGISRPSSKKAGHHEGWKGRLKSIDLKTCTTFIDNYDDSELGMRALFQRAHNEWFDVEDMTRPLWRLIIVNHVHVIFVWQHLVCDGKGGIAFHKSLLGALNEIAKEGDVEKFTTSTVVTTSTKPLPTNAADLFKENGRKPNILASLLQVFGIIFFRLWHGRRSFFFDDATYSKAIPVLGQVKKEDRCVTSIQGFRLSPAIVENCLIACKKNQTTFTSMLATIFDMTLAIDVYPLSKVRMLNRQIDLRRYLPQTDNMTNLSTTISRMSKVYKYRKAGREIAPDSSQFWDLAREDVRWLQNYISDKRKTPIPIRDSMFPTPETEEGYATNLIPHLYITTEGSYTISNLGAVDSKFGTAEEYQPWEMSAIEFSCCATKSCIGSIFYFAVVSLKGEECAVNVSYEKGVLKDEKVREIMEKIEQRLTAMFED